MAECLTVFTIKVYLPLANMSANPTVGRDTFNIQLACRLSLVLSAVLPYLTCSDGAPGFFLRQTDAGSSDKSLYNAQHSFWQQFYYRYLIYVEFAIISSWNSELMHVVYTYVTVRCAQLRSQKFASCCICFYFWYNVQWL